MNCREARSLFSDFYDRELNRGIRQAVREHLSNCSECRTEFKNFQKSLKILKKLKAFEVPRDFMKDSKYRESPILGRKS